jgi:hypothetical protein
MPANEQEVITLTEALEHMPLAVVQAASYIRQRAPIFSITRYLKIFRENDVGKGRHLAWEVETQCRRQLRWDRDAKNSVLITWQISFNDLQQTRESAADPLSLMSFFGRQGTPINLLESDRTTKESQSDKMEGNSGSRSHGDEKAPSSPGIEGFMNDIMILRDYSFISIAADEKAFQMHALVQLATRTSLQWDTPSASHPQTHGSVFQP